MAVDLGQEGKGRRARRGARPAMNVTPLVDVVLVLLIIFMVVTPLLTRQMWLHVPPKDDARETPPPAEPDAPLVLTVHRDGTAKLNAEPIPDAEIEQRLARVLAARRDKVVFFDAGDDVPYGRAMQVLDAARGGGAVTIAVSPTAISLD